jgi:hypothetical protein
MALFWVSSSRKEGKGPWGLAIAARRAAERKRRFEAMSTSEIKCEEFVLWFLYA